MKLLLAIVLSFASTLSMAQEPFIRVGMFSIAQPNDLLKIPLSDIDRFSLIIARRDQAFNYDNSSATNRPTLWQRFRAADPSKKVHLYSWLAANDSNSDSVPRTRRSRPGRVFTSIAGDAPPDGTILSHDWFLCGVNRSPCPAASRVKVENDHTYFVKFADPAYISWFAQYMANDLDETTATGATGYHFDVTRATRAGSPSAVTPGYQNQDAWGKSILSAYKQIAKASNIESEATLTTQPNGLAIWAQLDDAPPAERPDMLVTEFMWTIGIPEQSNTRFKNGTLFDQMFEVYKNTTNVSVFSNNCSLRDTNTPLKPDDFGDPVTQERMLHYSLASFLLVKRDNPRWYFGCYRNNDAPGVPWFPEYDSMLSKDGVGNLNLGAASGEAVKTGKIYYRKFARGAVIVNPSNAATGVNVADLFGGPVVVVNRANLKTAPGNILKVSTVTVPRLSALFVLFQ